MLEINFSLNFLCGNLLLLKSGHPTTVSFPNFSLKDFPMNSIKNLELNGRLRNHSLAELIIEIAKANLNGSLRLENAERKAVFYFDGGELVFAASNARQHRLFEILLRENKITKAQLTAIKDFTNDLELKEALAAQNIFSKAEVDALLTAQITEILQTALNWLDGEWIFSPLVRIRNNVRYRIDLRSLLFDHARNLPDAVFINKFKSLDERFILKPAAPANISLLPQEAFVLSRFDRGFLTIDQIINLSGLSETQTFRTLYTLWLGGFLIRQDWNAVFTDEKTYAIQSAKLTLKKEQPARQPAGDMARFRAAQPSENKTVENTEEIEQQEEGVSLEKYLEQVENADSHYETLGISMQASSADVKAAYFALAKRFHPDLYQRKVNAEEHARIQQVFTELAHAYDVLRTQDSREVYDYKLRKRLEAGSIKTKKASASPVGSKQTQIEQAADNFEQGFTYLVQEDFEQAIPYLARAVHLAADNARYHAYYGKALASDQKTFRQAETELQAAIKLEGDNTEYRYMLAELYVNIGLIKRAEGELNRLLAIKPNHNEARSLLDSLRSK